MALFGRDSGRDGGRDGRGERGATVPTTAVASTERLLGSGGPGTGRTMASIGKSIRFKGEMTGEEDLVIEGNFEGKVNLPNNELTIGTNGTVKADVDGKSVVVVGHLVGNVTATERVEVQASGVVDGDVRAPKLVIQEGAVLNGAVEMTGGSAPAAKSASASLPKSAPAAEARP